MQKIFLIAYILSVIVYLFIRWVDNYTLALIFQPLMLVLLGCFYFVSTTKKNYLFLTALLLTMIGGFFFIYEYSIERFAIVLSLILITNSMFLIIIVHRMNTVKIKDILLTFIPIYVSLSILIYYFFDVLPVIKFLVFVYTITLSLLFSFAFFYYKSSRKKESLLMLVSIVFMILRDFFHGLSRLFLLEGYYWAIIILSHALALYFICQSMILYDKELLNQNDN